MAKDPISVTWCCGMSSRKVIPIPLKVCINFGVRSFKGDMVRKIVLPKLYRFLYDDTGAY